MDNTNLNPPRLRIWDQMVLKFGIAKIAGLGVGAFLLAVSVGVAVVFPSFRGDLRQRANEERYGITDNLCHLPGANCTTDEDWQKGNAAARGDKKATQELADKGHLKIDEGGNAVAVTQNVSPTTVSSVGTGGTAETKSGASQISDAAKNIMAGYLKNNVGGVVVNGCNVNLGLCPMIDPSSGKQVGYLLISLYLELLSKRELQDKTLA
jgi:hypothetical protein